MLTDQEAYPSKYTHKQQAAHRELWQEALRSGDYKQGKGALNNKGKMCCLGVACDISGLGRWINPKEAVSVDPEPGKIKAAARDSLSYLSYTDSVSNKTSDVDLIEIVQNWLGVYSPLVELIQAIPGPCEGCSDGLISLAEVNDEGYSFEYIANLIKDKKIEVVI